jgi:hypothetical protein
VSDEIKTASGRVIGKWDGRDVVDLQQELARIRRELEKDRSSDRPVPTSIPHRDQLPIDLHKFTAYVIWGCDSGENCLCGANANRVVTVADVRRFSLIDHH